MKYKVGDKIVFLEDYFLEDYSMMKKGETATITSTDNDAYVAVTDDRTLVILHMSKVLFEGTTEIVGLKNDDADKAKETYATDKTIRPDYYKFHGYDVFDIADYFGLSFPLGNAIKYILRHKDETKRLQDIKKARRCLDRAIELMEGKANESGRVD